MGRNSFCHGTSVQSGLDKQKDASSPFLISAVLQSDPIIAVLRRELRRISPRASIDDNDLRSILAEEVLKRDVVSGNNAKSAASRVRRAAKRALRKRAESADPNPSPVDEAGESGNRGEIGDRA